MGTEEKREALALYRDRNVQILLNKFLNCEIQALEPVFNQQTGYHYPAVEKIVGDTSQAEAFLNKLYNAGIIEKKLYDEVIFCPKCSSADISIRYCCPFCKSFNIQKNSLIEHVKCGYMDVEPNFHSGDKLICPNAKKNSRKPMWITRKPESGAPARTAAKALTYQYPNISAETATQPRILRKP
jgi:hypothetical protein